MVSSALFDGDILVLCRCGTKLGQFWDEIGTALELTRESIYVRLSMLKTVITSENDSGRTPKGVFFHAPAVKGQRPVGWALFSFFGTKKEVID